MSRRPRRRLRNRLALAFAGFTLVVAALFGFYAVAFTYSTEDAFFDAMLEREAASQSRARAERGAWRTPQDAWMTVHADPSSFPADLRAAFTAEPWRVEFRGHGGRHYHLKRIAPPPPLPSAWLVAEVSAQLVVRPLRGKILSLLAWSGLATVVMALLLGYALARRTAAPLARLAGRVEDMAPGHLPDDFAKDYPGDEVGVLAHGLEDLARRVNAFIAREREFTRDASHELRTPLAVIRSVAEHLAAEPALSADGRRLLAHAHRSALQLEQTVATLLALAREEGVAPPATSAVLPVLERVVVEQSPRLDGKPVAVVIEVPPDARVAVPAPILHILLSNLIGNAFSHTPAGCVRVDAVHGRLRLRNPAAGGDADAPRGGHGFGLSIVRRLCERYRTDLRIAIGDDVVEASLPLDAGGIAGVAVAAPQVGVGVR